MNPLLAASSWPPVVQTAIGAVAAIAGGAFAQWFTWQRATRLSYSRVRCGNPMRRQIQQFSSCAPDDRTR